MSPRYRNSTLHAWRGSDRNQRTWMVLEGVVATLVGVGIPLLITWLLLVRSSPNERMQPTALHG